MKYVGKTLRPRLPKEVAEKLRHATGGGRHHDKKADYQRRPKHKNKEDFSSGEHPFATFIRFITEGGESVEVCSSERKGGIEMERHDNAEWILRTVRHILKDVGPKAARRFLESRGGTARWQAAAQEIARHSLREHASTARRTFSQVLFFIGVITHVSSGHPVENWFFLINSFIGENSHLSFRHGYVMHSILFPETQDITLNDSKLE